MKKSIERTFIVFLGIFMPYLSIAQWSVVTTELEKDAAWYLVQKFTPEEWTASNFASDEEMQWFKDARYGMFIHFGLSTYIGKDLSWGMCYTRKAPDSGHGPIADSVWTKYPDKFVFENFDARKWVEIAQKAGMKYIVTIAKHHDGFHMWDTQFSDFKVTNTPFGRDYLKEIANACHEAGMKFGIYYSQRDWYHPDYAPVDTSLIVQQNTPPYFKAKTGATSVKPGPTHEKYNEYQFNVVRELCTQYGKVDIFWFDACWWGGMFTADMWHSEKLTRMIRDLQPGIIINNRASLPGDFDTPEQKVGMYQQRPWESCMTLCSTWSWSDTPVKSKKDLIRILTATASGNGNILLSWGPKWDGVFDAKQVERLEEIGDWLNKYGHTIYDTKGGPWYPENWGGSTYRGNKVYVHITSEADKQLLLPSLNNKILKASCLTGGKISYKQTPGAVILELGETLSDESTIVELTFEHEITEMAREKHKLSRFSDPVYGRLMLSKENLKSDKGILSVDLGQETKVTGLGLEKLASPNKGPFTVEVSSDGTSWKLVEKDITTCESLELTISQFNAGIQLPGVDCRFVRISQENTNTGFQIDKLLIYGN